MEDPIGLQFFTVWGVFSIVNFIGYAIWSYVELKKTKKEFTLTEVCFDSEGIFIWIMSMGPVVTGIAAVILISQLVVALFDKVKFGQDEETILREARELVAKADKKDKKS